MAFLIPVTGRMSRLPFFYKDAGGENGSREGHVFLLRGFHCNVIRAAVMIRMPASE